MSTSVQTQYTKDQVQQILREVFQRRYESAEEMEEPMNRLDALAKTIDDPELQYYIITVNTGMLRRYLAFKGVKQY